MSHDASGALARNARLFEHEGKVYRFNGVKHSSFRFAESEHRHVRQQNARTALFGGYDERELVVNEF